MSPRWYNTRGSTRARRERIVEHHRVRGQAAGSKQLLSDHHLPEWWRLFLSRNWNGWRSALIQFRLRPRKQTAPWPGMKPLLYSFALSLVGQAVLDTPLRTSR